MEAHIDPEINAVSKRSNGQERDGSSAAPKNSDHPIDQDAVDTATRALKVLAYMPSEGEEDEEESNVENTGATDVLNSKHSGAADQYISFESDNQNIDGAETLSGTNIIKAPTQVRDSSISAPFHQAQAASSMPSMPLNFVMMDPSTKDGLSKRLGRPRKTFRSKASPEQSSQNNVSESVISRFRVDTPKTNGSTHGQIHPHHTGMASNARVHLKLNKFNGAREEDASGSVHRKKKRKMVHNEDGFKMFMELTDIQEQTKKVRSLYNNSKRSEKKPVQFSDSKIVLENASTLQAKGRSTKKDRVPPAAAAAIEADTDNSVLSADTTAKALKNASAAAISQTDKTADDEKASHDGAASDGTTVSQNDSKAEDGVKEDTSKIGKEDGAPSQRPSRKKKFVFTVF